MKNTTHSQFIKSDFVKDNKDFYPTPNKVSEMLLKDLELSDSHVLEPQGGSGDLIRYIKSNFINCIVSTCELDDRLAILASNEADRFITNDCLELTPHDVAHMDFIIMNPPFSNAMEIIHHMFNIMPEGCVLRTLFNDDNLSYQKYRKGLTGHSKVVHELINKFGKHTHLNDCFSTAERRTSVEVGLIELCKPDLSKDEFKGFFDEKEEDEIEFNNKNGGFVKYDEIRDIVMRYVGAVKKYDSVEKACLEMNELTKPFSLSHIEFIAIDKETNYKTHVKRDEFKSNLQKAGWNEVLKRLNMQKYLTSSSYEKIVKFVESKQNTPFTVKNIYRLVDTLIQTYDERIKEIIVDVFNNLTRIEKNKAYFKTNASYRVNKKFIMHNVASREYRFEYYEKKPLDDLYKALCFITGTKFNEQDTFDNFMQYDKVEKYDSSKGVYKTELVKKEHQPEIGKWHEWGFLKIKTFLNGNLHAEFLEQDVCDMFNQTACKLKGFVIPPDFYERDGRKRKSTGMKVYK